MQNPHTYQPQNTFRESLLQLIAENENHAEKYRKILHFISSYANSSFDLQQLQFLLSASEMANNAPVQEKNWVFIDMQNVYKAVCEQRWKIDWKLFRQFLSQEYKVEKAIVFVGYLKENTHLYKFLQKVGFEIKFREVEELPNGYIDGGNCDTDLAATALNFKHDYDKAIIIADDGDYSQMLKMLKDQNKLKFVLSPHSVNRTSKFIKNAIGIDSILSIQSIRHLIEYKR